jgi:hypothetical protein
MSVSWGHRGCALVATRVAAPMAEITGTVASPVAHAKNADTPITGAGIVQTVDCNQSTLFTNGAENQITAMGSCWALTTQDSSNIVIADNVVNDITVCGWDQTVRYKTGDPAVLDRGRE